MYYIIIFHSLYRQHFFKYFYCDISIILNVYRVYNAGVYNATECFRRAGEVSVNAPYSLPLKPDTQKIYKSYVYM